MKELTTDYDLGISRLDVNILDHAEYYRSRIKPYGPAAIVAHLYVIDHGVFAGDRPFKCCAKVAAEYDLRCIRLPWSWYEPTACMPVLYLRKRTT